MNTEKTYPDGLTNEVIIEAQRTNIDLSLPIQYKKGGVPCVVADLRLPKMKNNEIVVAWLDENGNNKVGIAPLINLSNAFPIEFKLGDIYHVNGKSLKHKLFHIDTNSTGKLIFNDMHGQVNYYSVEFIASYAPTPDLYTYLGNILDLEEKKMPKKKEVKIV